MFTVKELRELIKDMPEDTPIVLQADDEGNSYRYMNGIEFVPSGENSNYFNEDDEKCVRQSDFEYLEIKQETAKEEGFVLCAVVY